jgi:hypothetical protein
MNQPAPGVTFRDAIAQTRCLRLQQGLQAIRKGEGRGRITASDNRKILGSVCIDEDCKKAEPNANRWDYAVGYNRAGKPLVFYIEEHSADTHGVREMEKKFQWIKDFLRRPRSKRLSRLANEFHWLQHKGMKIPKDTPQYRVLSKLRAIGLNGPLPSLTLS